MVFCFLGFFFCQVDVFSFSLSQMLTQIKVHSASVVYLALCKAAVNKQG